MRDMTLCQLNFGLKNGSVCYLLKNNNIGLIFYTQNIGHFRFKVKFTNYYGSYSPFSTLFFLATCLIPGYHLKRSLFPSYISWKVV